MLFTIFGIFSSILFSQTLFFSEYAEGTSNNKYLEIYNPTTESIDLSGYAFPSTANEPSTPGQPEYWNDFDAGSMIAPGDVFVICHGSSDALILSECDQYHTYLSNGNDGYCLVSGTESTYNIIDCIGDWNADPGYGWDVAGVSEATKDHTLVRKDYVENGNEGNWSASAGTNDSDSEWEVYDVNTWDYLGSHNSDGSGGTGGGDDGTPSADAGGNQVVDFGAMVTLDGSGSYDSDGTILGYSWSQVSGPAVDVDNYEQAVISFSAPSDYCVLEFSLQVFDDGFNYSSIDYVTVTVGSVSIYDFQYTEEQGQYCYESSMDGEEVTVSGIVSHIKPSSSSFFLQDSECNDLWCAVFVYDNSASTQVGDYVSVTAEVEEYFSMTELVNVSSYSIISSGNDISKTSINASDLGIDCSLSAEQYESMLVEVTDVSFDSVDEFGNWTISDGSGTTLVDDYYYDGTFPTISEGDTFDCISGVVAYSYSEFKIYPRNAGDFECSSECISNGDVNSDMNVDVLDIVSIVGYVLGNSTFDSNQLCISDINQDANVDVLDIVSIVSSILGNR